MESNHQNPQSLCFLLLDVLKFDLKYVHHSVLASLITILLALLCRISFSFESF